MIKPEWKAEQAHIGYSSQKILVWRASRLIKYVIREQVPVFPSDVPAPFILGLVIDPPNTGRIDNLLHRFATFQEAQEYAVKFHQELIK